MAKYKGDPWEQYMTVEQAIEYLEDIASYEYKETYDAHYKDAICAARIALDALKETKGAVEVVRCKDCLEKGRPILKYKKIFCQRFSEFMDEKDFCSYGKAREQNGMSVANNYT